jgi:hypothetical protein
MPAYLVRTIDSMTWSEFFAATSIVDLVVLVDEAVDADKCEYQRLGSGDIMWTGPAVAIPIEGAGGDDEEISEAKISWEGARFCTASQLFATLLRTSRRGHVLLTSQLCELAAV